MNKNLAVVALAAAIGGSAITHHLSTRNEAPSYVFAQDRALPLTFAPMIRQVTPAVVNVTSEVRPQRNQRGARRNPQGVPPGMEDLFRDFFGGGVPEGPQRRPGGGLGSGVIVSNDGYILTNNHVVEGADRVTVSLADRREFTAKVVGTDPATDVAVLKVDATKLPVLPLSDSAKVQVGDLALAIGNPFGVGQTVTMGIVGATGRAALGTGGYEDFIQTDAAINPGNSGGALVNANGQLIGINTAIISRGGGNQGIGFAIPINMAREVMDQLVKSGKVTRGYIGVTPQDVSADLARHFKLGAANGAAVTSVVKDGPAAKAGIQVGDIITEVDGASVADANALRLRISRTAPGSVVKLTVRRGDANQTIPVTLGTLPTDDDEAATPGEELGPGGSTRSSLEGVNVQNLTPQIARQLQLDDEATGVVVANVEPDSAAAEAGLRPRDVIQQVNRKPVASVAEFQAAVKAAGGRSVLLLVNRGRGTLFIVVEPEGGR